MNKIKLTNGVEIPAIIYGPGILSDYNKRLKKVIKDSDISVSEVKQIIIDRKKEDVIKKALSKGYYGLDTASAYGDAERIIGKLINKYPKDNIFITTKISNKQQLKKNVFKVYDYTLKTMGLKYIDLYLLHWPQPGYLDTWKQMEQIYFEGKIKAIGVCNFQLNHFENLMNIAQIKPMVHQFELHPLFTQREMCDYCKDNEIQVMAYTPVARCDDRLMNDSHLQRIAKNHKKTIVQVILRWHYQKGHISIVGTNNIKHLEDNCRIFDFDLNNYEMEIIDHLNINSRLRYDSNNCNFRDL